MISFFEFDFLIRKVISYSYRICLILYAIAIIIRYDNLFHPGVYVVALTTYAVLSYNLVLKRGRISILRLWFDMILISMILYGKFLDDPVKIVFLFLPIFNTPNSSVVRRSYLTLFATAVGAYILIEYPKVDWWMSIPFFILFVISYLEYHRTKALNFYYSLNKSIVEFYSYRHETAQVEEEIFSKVITKFNGSKFSSICALEQILYIKVTPTNYFIQASNNISTKLEIPEKKHFYHHIKDKVTSGLQIVVNGKSTTENIVVSIADGKNYDAFILIGNFSGHLINKLSSLRNRYFLNPLLHPFFYQLAKLLKDESLYQKSRTQIFKKIMDEYNYVLGTINAVHFIRNRLTPFNNYLHMVKDFNNTSNTTITPEQRKQLSSIIEGEYQQALSSLKEIAHRANAVLENENNPFDVTKELEDFKIKSIFFQLKNAMDQILGTGGISTNIGDADFEKVVRVSKNGINIVFSDLFSNINKYNDGHVAVNFDVQGQNLVISFENNFKSSAAEIAKLKEMISYFESNENYGIFKMSTKGVFLIKDFLRQMSVKVVHALDENQRLLKITLLLNVQS